MSLSLGQKQDLFARCFHALLGKAFELGFDVRLREVGRGRQQAAWNASHCAVQLPSGRCERDVTDHPTPAGHAFAPIGALNSLHVENLAGDLVLVSGGIPLWDTESYRELGEYWETLHALCYWGGRSGKPGDRLQNDGGHFAITHRGYQ